MTVAPTVDDTGESDVVNGARAFAPVFPFTATASVPESPLPALVIVLVDGLADVIRDDTLETTTVLPGVFGDAGIEPPAVLSGAEPLALSGEVPTLGIDIVKLLSAEGAAGTNKPNTS